MKRRIFTLLTAVCLIFTTILGSSKIVSADTTFTAPQIGHEVSGFTVNETTYDQATKSNKILFEHIKTGAKVLVINNNDVNRGFSIKFNTPPDNRGNNHILEHSVLGGSEKYPTKNTIFDITNTTYVSFANAFTYPNMTMYPICSQSEEQLYKSADIYLDAVFNPLILNDERIFQREGWRYELTDPSSPLAYNGIVYNEMQGSMGSISSVATSNANKTIFSNTDQGNNSGGNPNDILALTYEDLIDTHNKYYHPSNSFMVLYGDLDYERFLNMIDTNYLSSYTKKEIDIPRLPQEPFDKLVEKTYTFPVSQDTETEIKSVIDLVFAVDDIKELGMEGYMSLNLAISLLNLESSDIKKAMMASQIAESYAMQLDISTYQPTIHFMALNADPDRSKDFYNLVMKELDKVVKKGLDTDLVKSLLRSMEFEEVIGTGNAVNEIILSSLFDNLINDPMDDYLSYIRVIADKLEQNVLEDIIKKHLIDNKLAALTVTKPEPGLLEQNYMTMIRDLAVKKASMTDDEIQALVNETAEFDTWNNEATPDDVLKSLSAVDLKDISVEVKEREIDKTSVDGVNLWSTKADVDEVSKIQYNFDLNHLDEEELLYLKFYIDMMNNGMDTKNRSEMQVISDISNKLYSMSSEIGAYTENKDDTLAHPIYTLSYYSFEEEYDDTFELVYDILLQSDIENVSTYGKRVIANIKANYEMQFAEPIGLMQYRSLAYTSATYRLYNYLYGLDYYNFIVELEKDIASNPEEVYYKLNVVRAKAFTHNKNNMHILFAGDSDAKDKFIDAMPTFTNNLYTGSFNDVEYNLPVPSKREAIVINSPVQYICVNASLPESDVPVSAKSQVISTILNNLMLTPEIRLKGGAYGVGASFIDNNYLVYTYRDSNYVNSLNVIGATGEFLLAVAPYMTEDILENYILSLFGTVNQSGGEINDAMNTLVQSYHGITIQEIIDKLEEMKNTTVADIITYSEYMAKINENLNYIIAASPDEIDKNKELFDSIISLIR